MLSVSTPPQQMQCMEVWGGSQMTARNVELGGLDAWVYSKPYQQAQRGGDVYYASSCATGRITRLLLADVSGHGNTVAATAADLRTLMRRFVNRLDQTEFVRELNQEFAALSREGSFATAIVGTFFAPTGRLILSNAGHPRPFVYRAADNRWDFLGEGYSAGASGPQNLPLGIIALTEYRHFDIELADGDCLLGYTDALIESRDADGEMFGEEGLLRLVRLLGYVQPNKMIDTLLAEIADRHPGNLTDDDVTVLMVRANGKKPRLSFATKAKAAMSLLGSLVRSLKPGGEPAALPDANLANVGGAIIPALEQRWRSGSPTR